MSLYWQIAKSTWDQTTAYRASFIIYRVRNVLWMLTTYFLWLTVIPKGSQIFDYNQSQILTYILGGSFLSSLVLATRSQDIATEINEGNLSNFLLRPINYLAYYFARDMGDKAMNIVFSVIELTILFFLLRPPLFIQTNPQYLFLAIAAAIIGTILYFFLSVLLGFVGFWSNETWGPRFIFYQVLVFFAGTFFPLDILPKNIYHIVELLPFTYLLYFPMKIYLAQIPSDQIVKGIVISIFWTAVVYAITQYIWKKGLRVYTAQGR